ncbi:MAG: MBL fold metallo-hydrolase [Nitrososphaerota archaeon]|nr:MBL fold metallo-hydrolase [Nitrososphaerota archaeon]MDG6922946.1 MBL fold metallo-hydrolase [Nitrososphaerota archaeon]
MKSYVFLEQISVGTHKNFSYLIADKDARLAAVVDPAWEVDKLHSKLAENNLTLEYIINTHAHYDHIDGNKALQEKTGAKIVMHESSKAKKDIAIQDAYNLEVGKVKLRFIHTPGHSPESMCVVVDDFALLTGDTLFIGECGRVDLPGGDAGELFESFERIRHLDPDLVVYPGHDYGTTSSSTLREQIATNYTLTKRTKSEFIRFMEQP